MSWVIVRVSVDYSDTTARAPFGAFALGYLVGASEWRGCGSDELLVEHRVRQVDSSVEGAVPFHRIREALDARARQMLLRMETPLADRADPDNPGQIVRRR